MHYIAPRAMRIETDPTPLPLIWRGNTVARGSTPSSLDELMDKLSIRLASPAVLQIVAANSQDSLCLVRLGFRSKLPDDMGIRWLRFSTEVSHTGGEGNPTRPVGIVSFSPERVAEDLVYDGHIAVDDGGTIQRNPTANGEGTPEFPAYALGYLTRPNRLVWDFLPRLGGVIPGSDNLMLTAKMPNDGEVCFLETVQMCVAHRLYGDGTFEYSPTTKIVLMGKTP